MEQICVNCTRPPPNKPKPNTRFLRNIIKDTDSHNAALLAKEVVESRSRLHGLNSNQHREERASRIGGSDIRRRQLGDIAAILGGGPPKQKRTNGLERNNLSSNGRSASNEDGSSKARANQKNIGHGSRDGKFKDEEEPRRCGRRSREDEESEDFGVRRKHRRRERSITPDGERDRNHGERHRSVSRDQGRKRDSNRRYRCRSRSPREYRTKESRHHHRSSKRRFTSPIMDEERPHRSHHRSRSPQLRDRESTTSTKTAKREEPEAAYDSDPLDDIIGPRPASLPVVRSRGRGIFSGASGIEARFSASYDPSTDVQLDPDEENDWDQALEALRDRQKWHQAGAARLRAAGFTDEEIAKWERGGEKKEEDVRWVKRGESREWDRGKVIDDEGVVSTDLNWGRLKGT